MVATNGNGKHRKREPPETGRNGLVPRGGLAPKQEAAAIALAGGATYEEASRQSGAGVTTIKTWLNDPAMKTRVAEARAELSARVLGRISKGMMTAIARLEHLAEKGKTEVTQLRACEALLLHGTALAEVAEIKARLTALETGGRR